MTTPKTIRALLVSALALMPACADAPITAAQLQDDGQLREGQALIQDRAQEGSVALFSVENPKLTHEAQSIALSSRLDSSVEELERARKRADTREVNLRLLGEGLSGPLPVAIVWTHEGQRREQTAVVEPERGLSLAATQSFDEEAMGLWRVEVYALRAGDRDLMIAREFEVQL